MIFKRKERLERKERIERIDSSMKQAFIFWGGWDGHEPKKVAKRFEGILKNEGFAVTVSDNDKELADLVFLKRMDLIVPVCTGGDIKSELTKNVAIAVGSGVGLAGCHGGMCDAFRNDVEWQFMTGGQWVSHPGGDGVEYTVNLIPGSDPLVDGLSDFVIRSEHYYLHTDPANKVLATTRFPNINYYHSANPPVDMPVVWTRMWGCGRVFYNSLGHHDDVFDQDFAAQELMRRGMLWAAEGKAFAVANGLTDEPFLNNAKMY